MGKRRLGKALADIVKTEEKPEAEEAAEVSEPIQAMSVRREKSGWVLTSYEIPPQVASRYITKRNPPDTKPIVLAKAELAFSKVQP